MSQRTYSRPSTLSQIFNTEYLPIGALVELNNTTVTKAPRDRDYTFVFKGHGLVLSSKPVTMIVGREPKDFVTTELWYIEESRVVWTMTKCKVISIPSLPE